MSSRRNVIAKDEQEEPGEEAQSKAAASSSKTGDLLHASRVEGPRRRSARLASKAMLERSP